MVYKGVRRFGKETWKTKQHKAQNRLMRVD